MNNYEKKGKANAESKTKKHNPCRGERLRNVQENMQTKAHREKTTVTTTAAADVAAAAAIIAAAMIAAAVVAAVVIVVVYTYIYI